MADADGSFRFDVEAGRYELSAVAPGCPWTTLSFGATSGTVWANETLLNGAPGGPGDTGSRGQQGTATPGQQKCVE